MKQASLKYVPREWMLVDARHMTSTQMFKTFITDSVTQESACPDLRKQGSALLSDLNASLLEACGFTLYKGCSNISATGACRR